MKKRSSSAVVLAFVSVGSLLVGCARELTSGQRGTHHDGGSTTGGTSEPGSNPLSGGAAGATTGAGGTPPWQGGTGGTGYSGPSMTETYPDSVLCPPPIITPPGELSQGFATTCAGCHGPTGEGLGPFPSLKEVKSLEEMTQVVRSGRPGTAMPAFTAEQVPDAQMASDFAALRAASSASSADPDCGLGILGLPTFTDQELDERIEAGLQAYRKEGVKGACAGCHSAAGIDMAFIGFSDAAIYRRASDVNKLSTEDAAKIVEMVHALRIRYGVDRPLHPLKFRFMQPGFEVLPEQPQPSIALGDGPGAHDAARDRAFAALLSDELKLLLAGDTITSLEQAQAAQKQLLELDLLTLPTGIELELWTEDKIRGPEHNVPTEWIPGLARHPATGKEADWYALVDQYRADPSDAKLWQMYDAIAGLTSGDEAYALATNWSFHKYQAVQIASHMLLQRSLKTPDPFADESPTDPIERRNHALAHNPFWLPGDDIRVNPLNCNTTDPCTTFPPSIDETINTGDAARERMSLEDKLSWFWLGFMLDPALLVTKDAVPTTDGDYFLAATQQYLNVTNAFLVAAIMTHKANAPKEYIHMQDAISTSGHGLWASPRPFLPFKHSERELHFPPPGDSRTPVHAQLWANALRMALFLMNDELKQTNQVFDRARTLQNVKFIRHWFGSSLEVGTDLTALDALVSELTGRLASAEEIGTVIVTQPFDTTDPVVLPELP